MLTTIKPYVILHQVLRQHLRKKTKMREWLSGGAPPCQGGGRGFDPRLALLKKSSDTGWYRCFFFESNPGLEVRSSPLPLRSAQSQGPPDLVRRLALSKKKKQYRRILFLFFESNHGLEVLSSSLPLWSALS